MIRLFAVIALVLAAPALAKAPLPVPATCDTLAAVMTTVAPGSTVALTGNCSTPINIAKHTYSSRVTLDATASTFVSLVFNDVHGLTLVGGKAIGASPTTGVSFGSSSDIVVDGLACDGKPRCMVLGNDHDVVLSEVTVTNPGIDGVDLDLVQRVLVQRLKCMGFNPLPNAHPDCLQIFDTAGEPHVSDVAVTDSVIVGQMQGIGYFDHGRASAMERITITGNRLMTSMPDGIVFNGRCAACVFRNNTADALPGSPHYIQINTGQATPAYPGAIANNIGGNVRPMRVQVNGSAAALVAAAVATPGTVTVK